MTSMEKIKQLEAQMEGLVLQEAEEEWKKVVKDVDRDRRKREELEKRLQEQERANQDNYQGRAGTNRSFDSRPLYFSGPNRPPKVSSTSAKVANWEQRMSLFLEA